VIPGSRIHEPAIHVSMINEPAINEQAISESEINESEIRGLRKVKQAAVHLSGVETELPARDVPLAIIKAQIERVSVLILARTSVPDLAPALEGSGLGREDLELLRPLRLSPKEKDWGKRPLRQKSRFIPGRKKNWKWRRNSPRPKRR
jgi:hypothetical protein